MTVLVGETKVMYKTAMEDDAVQSTTKVGDLRGVLANLKPSCHMNDFSFLVGGPG